MFRFGKRPTREVSTSRREFLMASGLGPAALLATSPGAELVSHTHRPPLREHGFWDYTTPGAGGMEAFQKGDYLSLLDDMAQSGMNSLMIYVKWLTTGYRSRLSFLDQVLDNPVIVSDNTLLRQVIEEAGKHRIKVWLGAAVTYFEMGKLGSRPNQVIERMGGFRLPIKVGLYDTDTTGFSERVAQIYEELVELFPGVGGLGVELEGAGMEAPHRIDPYNQWAKQNGRPPFEKLGHPFDPRTFEVGDWRDYTTYSRLKALRAIENAVRGKGFGGDLAMICETGRTKYAIGQEVNLKEFHKQFPGWITITYEYEKWDHRYAMMDVCIDQPKQEGMKVFYLPRGVMTWGAKWPLPIPLEQSWRLDLDDIRRFQPDGVWWFGCGTANEGAHVSASRLHRIGYRNPADARRALLKTVSELREI